MTTPTRIYKYENWTARTLQNLKSQIIYFGSPLGFNDPYDCALNPSIRTPSDDEVHAILQRYLNKTGRTLSERQALEALPTASFRELLINSGRKALEKLVQDFLKTNGVACFSERNDDLLMWSHYGGRYRGLCLEFSTTFAPFTKLHQVQYTKCLPVIDLLPLLDSALNPFVDLFCTKSESWAYEKEWRAHHDQAGTEYGYLPQALTGVFFGPDIDNQSMEIVCLILQGQNEHVKFWRGARSTTEFKVLYEEFTYLSFLEAKKLGLR